MQTPAPFEYERATSVDGAIASLERLGADARVIAGGHSLLPMMKLRLASPSHLIDINDLEGELAVHPRGGRRAARSARSRGTPTCWSPSCSPTRFPVFRDAEQVIADPVVRNRGTIGGSLCQADAAEDLSAVCAALKARVVIRGSRGTRTVPMGEFHVGPWMTAVGAGEMVTEIRLPLRPGARQRAREGRAPRGRLGDRGRVGGASGSTAARSPTPASALSAVGPTTIDAHARARSCCAASRRRRSCSSRPAQIASEDCSPIPDGRGPVDYKRHLAGVLTKRALRRATARALHQEA